MGKVQLIQFKMLQIYDSKRSSSNNENYWNKKDLESAIF